MVFIDGAYLSLVSKFLGKSKHLKFDIKKFSENLAKKDGLNCKEVFYYNCPPFQETPPTNEQAKRKAGYDKFTSKLDLAGIKIREGRCQMINNEYTQKGVDVLLSIDLIRKANEIKNFILVACDTDFVPAIKDIREKDKVKVILYYFKDKDAKFSMSDHILSVCDKKVKLRKEDFISCPIKKSENIEIEEGFWNEGSYIKSINPNAPNFKERMRYFEEKPDDKKEYSCKKCKKAIGKHNLYWHEGMCNDCFFDEYNM